MSRYKPFPLLTFSHSLLPSSISYLPLLCLKPHGRRVSCAIRADRNAPFQFLCFSQCRARFIRDRRPSFVSSKCPDRNNIYELKVSSHSALLLRNLNCGSRKREAGSCKPPSMLTNTSRAKSEQGQHGVGEVAVLSLLSTQIVASIGGLVRKGERNV